MIRFLEIQSPNCRETLHRSLPKATLVCKKKKKKQKPEDDSPEHKVFPIFFPKSFPPDPINNSCSLLGSQISENHFTYCSLLVQDLKKTCCKCVQRYRQARGVLT